MHQAQAPATRRNPRIALLDDLELTEAAPWEHRRHKVQQDACRHMIGIRAAFSHHACL
jgi:hypothetical protein